MTRRYTNNSEDLNEPRVYVNNMNTAHATVEIPPRPPKMRAGDNNNNNNNYNNNNMSISTPYGGTARGGGGGGSGGGGGGDFGGDGGGGTPHAPILLPISKSTASNATTTAQQQQLAQQHVLHPNLENMYKKIMRKLQKELNYEETVRVPLSTQYGINQGDEEEGGGVEAAFQSSVNTNFNNTNTSAMMATTNGNSRVSSARPTSAFGSVSGSPPGGDDPNEATLKHMNSASSLHNNNNNNNSTMGNNHHNNMNSTISAAAASRDPSNVIRYRTSPPPTTTTGAGAAGAGVGGGASNTATAGAAGASSGGRTGKGFNREGEEEDEGWLAAQPCPRTLRLVLAHVCDTIEKKMSFAEQGSMQDCVRFTFESRSLLDRLLKELPYYTQFQESDIPAAAAESTTSNSKQYNSNKTAAGMQKLMQELRKSPVPVPRAQYQLGSQSGGVRAVLDLTEERALQQNGNNNNNYDEGFSNRLPPLLGSPYKVQFSEQSPQDFSSMNNTTATGIHRQYSLLADQLRGTDDNNNNNNNTNMNGLTLPETYGKSSRLLGKNNSNVSHVTNPNSVLNPLASGASPAATTSSFPDTTSHTNPNFGNIPNADISISAFGTSTVSMTTSGNFNSSGAAGRSRRGPDALGETQVMSVGTMTDDNYTTMVTREDYEALDAHVRELEVQHVESERLREQLDNRLLEEGDYNAKKANVIEYLRATLLKECNTLRAQLSFAAQKERYMQEAITAQQQQLASTSNAAAAGGGNTAGGMPGSASSHGHRNNERSMVLGRSNFSLAQSTRRLNATSANNNNNTSMVLQRSRGNLLSGNSMANLGTLRGGNNNNNNNNMSSTNIQNMTTSLPPEDPSSQQEGGEGDEAMNASRLVTHDITSIHSLLDLALLAIEKDEKFHLSSDMLHANRDMLTNDHFFSEGGGMGVSGTLSAAQQKQLMLEKDPKQQLDELRMAFEDKQRKLKYNYIAAQMEHQEVLGKKDNEIERLTYLTNTEQVAKALHQKVEGLKSDLRRLKNAVLDQCRSFYVVLQNSNSTLLNRAALLDKTMAENTALLNTQEAYMDLVASATSLLGPMMTPEYPRGYHPWPLKVRNSADPFAHLIQVRYGNAEVLRLRESINLMDDLYLQLHRFASRTLVVPDRSRPTVGRPLYTLCCGLLLSPQSNSEIYYEVRTRFSNELTLARRIAQLHFKYMYNLHLQQTLADRSVGALAEAGMDPSTTSLPVSRRINELATARGVLTRQISDLKKERQDNAREVYRLWKDRNIDIYQGYPTPLQQKQLTLLSDAQASQMRAKGASISSAVRMHGGGAGGRGAGGGAVRAGGGSGSGDKHYQSSEEKETERRWWKKTQEDQQAQDKTKHARVSQVEAMLRIGSPAGDSTNNDSATTDI